MENIFATPGRINNTISAPDNMRICVKYACKNLKYSLIEKS